MHSQAPPGNEENLIAIARPLNSEVVPLNTSCRAKRSASMPVEDVARLQSFTNNLVLLI
ncbi:hypothetical protein [Nostoc sp. WHI]|uniref:hypothetical protein n=1 Tax=Nostoc sp. WHI TaxID=2650611 RepID=UPI0018C5A761|nr:hypothetical protein [Nostoc sp. WHI]